MKLTGKKLNQKEQADPSRRRAKTADLNLSGQKIVLWPSRAGAKTKEGSGNSRT